MHKQDAIECIKMAGYSPETAEAVTKNFPESFSMGDAGIPDSVFDIIIDGMIEIMFAPEDEQS